MWRKSFKRPGCCGRSWFSQASRDWPPFQARVVNPKISTFTLQRSNVRANTSAHIAAIEIGLPRIDPELSKSKVTTVSLNSVSFSILKLREVVGFVITLASLPASRIPSSRSNNQLRFCCACRRLWSLFASLLTAPYNGSSCWSKYALNLSNSTCSARSSAFISSSKFVLKTW